MNTIDDDTTFAADLAHLYQLADQLLTHPDAAQLHPPHPRIETRASRAVKFHAPDWRVVDQYTGRITPPSTQP